jgi:glycosyltransferase involved in cell wall biosynthesis
VPSDVPLSADKKPCEILFVGRFDLHKGGDTILEAFACLAETHPHARLTFAGPDRGVPQPDGTTTNLASFLSGLPGSIKRQVTYKGRIDRSEVARLRSEHAIAVIASRYENLNYTLLEAMAVGQAIVSTNVGGPAEILENGQTALLVPPDDPGAMAAALGRLMDDDALRRRLGDTARASVARDFNPARIARETLRFVNTVLKG